MISNFMEKQRKQKIESNWYKQSKDDQYTATGHGPNTIKDKIKIVASFGRLYDCSRSIRFWISGRNHLK